MVSQKQLLCMLVGSFGLVSEPISDSNSLTESFSVVEYLRLFVECATGCLWQVPATKTGPLAYYLYHIKIYLDMIDNVADWDLSNIDQKHEILRKMNNALEEHKSWHEYGGVDCIDGPNNRTLRIQTVERGTFFTCRLHAQYLTLASASAFVYQGYL